MNNKDHQYLLSARTLSKIGEATGVRYNRDEDYTARRKRGVRTDTIRKMNEDPIVSVPIYDIRASAGSGSIAEDGEPTGYHPYRAQEISRLTRSDYTDLAVIQVAGDSMWDTLHDGDKVLVDRNVNRIVRDGIYILGYEGELLVKRCQRDLENGHVIVKSDNPAYDSFRITNGDQLNVIGRVVWIGRALG
jgi:phage repressor protein C with HTH and peptisase S24 domain